tara:strand:+ start:1442 stop:2038 length:597 start_codon:yes stop_codon:yes gene_type:complete
MNTNLKFPFICIGQALIVFAAYNLIGVFLTEVSIDDKVIAAAAILVIVSVVFSQFSALSIMNKSNSFLHGLVSLSALCYAVHSFSSNALSAEMYIDPIALIAIFIYANSLRIVMENGTRLESFYQYVYYKVPLPVYFLIGNAMMFLGFKMLELYTTMLEVGLPWFYLYSLVIMIASSYMILQGSLMLFTVVKVYRVAK